MNIYFELSSLISYYFYFGCAQVKLVLKQLHTNCGMSYFIPQGLLVYGFDVLYNFLIFLIPSLQYLQKEAVV